MAPWAVLNTAGYVRVDDAERRMRENALGPTVLAEMCGAVQVPLVRFSRDLVFDGVKGAPYVETDPVAPLNVYGRSKAEVERRVLAKHPRALVIRTSAFFGPWDEHNFVFHNLRALTAGENVIAACAALMSPTYVPDLAHASLDLLIDGETGIWHIANAGCLTWAEFARIAACALGSERDWIIPTLQDALSRFVDESGRPWRGER